MAKDNKNYLFSENKAYLLSSHTAFYLFFIVCMIWVHVCFDLETPFSLPPTPSPHHPHLYSVNVFWSSNPFWVTSSMFIDVYL